MSKITNAGLSRSGTKCFIAVPTWQQRADMLTCCGQIYDVCGVWMTGLLAVPVRSGTRVLAVMIMLNKAQNDIFTDRDKTSVEVRVVALPRLKLRDVFVVDNQRNC